MAEPGPACQNGVDMVAVPLSLALSLGCTGTATALNDGTPAPGNPNRDAAANASPPPNEPPEEQSIPADAYGGRGTSVAEEALERVRFVALGDAGQGNEAQYDVADAMEMVCAARGCDFAVYLGDNFYDTGVNELADGQFDEKFELPYANIEFPFWITLGNHDYGGGGTGYEFWKGNYYIEYSDLSPRWRLPDLFYTVDYGVLDLFSLDTTAMLWGFVDDQQAWFDATLAHSDATWTVAFGHHPYLSNGPHGNAGVYDGNTSPNPIWDGAHVKNLFDDSVCGKFDLYLSGHDHSLQWLETTCGDTELIVSGAGASITGLDGENGYWYQAESYGFVYFDMDASAYTATFYNGSGAELYSRTVTK